ncbi:MAG: phage terminase small subunit P27 family [Paracoccaceae bacterium]|uniref:phage terminase small subunit P27 family n=1 Tax=Parasphingorhabdus sp. TaxID=2709688 RepID=UPI003299AEFA
MRGRKPKPTQLKLITGTLRKSRTNKNEIRPDVVRPDPPDHLSHQAKIEWDRIVGNLFSLGIMTALDRGALAAYCQAYGRWVQAERALARFSKNDAATFGIMLKTSHGNAIVNPLVSAANKAQADMVRYAAEFGMTPSSRSRVSAATDKCASEARFFDD